MPDNTLLPSPLQESALIVILGHYGSGKTNLALNLALQLRALGREPLLVDLDVVNPYFRTTDYLELTSSEDIKVLGPVFGGSNLDAPSLAPGIDTAICSASLSSPVILDVGGDPDGARALVRYVPSITQVSQRLVLAVVNLRRPETQSLEDNLTMLSELSSTAGLNIDALIGNTHLAEFTTRETIEDSLGKLEDLAEASKIPLLAVTMPDTLQERVEDSKASAPFLPVARLVKTSWQ